MFKTLRSRLILSHILPVLVILPVIGAIFLYLLQSQPYIANANTELTNQAVLLSRIAGEYIDIWLDPSSGQAFVNSVSASMNAKAMLIDTQGRLISSSDPADKGKIGEVIFEPDLSQFFQNGSKQAEIHEKNGTITDVTVPVVTGFGRLAGYVRLDNPLASVFARYQQLRQVTLYVLFGGLLLGIVMGLILANDLQRPLQKTTQAANKLATGRQLTPLKEQGPEEIRLLLRAFNTLVERLRLLEEGRKRLLANLVHELGRPLGAMQSAVQALSTGADEDPALRRELLAGMDDELHRMRRLVEDLAQLHEQVLGTLELNVQPVELPEWLGRISAPWREAAQEKGLSWESDIPAGLPPVEIDPDRMAQAVGNLLSNAVRYTPPGGRVGLLAGVTDSETCIQVEDSGPGISSEEQNQVFIPFYRGKAARRFSDGMGLGLTIAQDLVQAHGGILWVESKPGKGSKFSIRLPRKPA